MENVGHITVTTALRRARMTGIGLLLLAAIFWSLGGLAIKLAKMDPVAFSFGRSLVGAMFVFPLIWIGKGNWPVKRWGAASAVIFTAVVTLVTVAMTRSTSATGILLEYTAPVFCALFAWLFQRQRIGSWTLAAMTLAAAGIVIMVVGDWQPGEWLGPTTGLLSGILFGALILTMDKTDRASGGVNPFAMIFVQNAGAVALLLPLCIAMGSFENLTPWQATIAGATGIIQLAIPYVLFQHGLRRVKPVDASLILLLEPVLNPVWVLFTGERPGGATIIGGAVILFALILQAVKPTSARQ